MQAAHQQEEEEAQENQRPSFDPIDTLAPHGIAPKIIEKLKAKGFHTVASIMTSTARKLQEADSSFTEQVVKKLVEAANKTSHFSFQSAKQYAIQREGLARISTGSVALDALLRGGIESSSMTELFGEFRTGKTQICHTLAVTAQRPTETSGGGKVLWIDTEGTFRPENIQAIATRFEMDPDEALENITYAKALSSDHQMSLLDAAATMMAGDSYGLLIVDSVTALFRTDFQGRGELADRQQKLAKYLRRLHILAEEYGVAVVVTNQVTAKVDGGMGGMGGPQVTPIGGNIMAHAAHTRLSLRKGRGTDRMCKVYDSPSLPESDAAFGITEAGIADATGQG